MMDMMDRIRLINEAIGKVDSRYRLSVILFKRARALNQGDMPLVEPKSDKEYIIALQEFLSGLVEWKDYEDTEWKKAK